MDHSAYLTRAARQVLVFKKSSGTSVYQKSDDIRGMSSKKKKTLNIREQSGCLFAKCTCVFKNAVKWGTPETVPIKHTRSPTHPHPE